jgi:hypothetical protein
LPIYFNLKLKNLKLIHASFFNLTVF